LALYLNLPRMLMACKREEISIISSFFNRLYLFLKCLKK
jgi:hypothetical protein